MDIKITSQLGAHACISSYLGGEDWENCGSRPAQVKKSTEKGKQGGNSPVRKHKIAELRARPTQAKARPYLKNNQSKNGWKCGSSSRAPAWQVQSPEFKPKKRNHVFPYKATKLFGELNKMGASMCDR
jgi:hypothetical protein